MESKSPFFKKNGKKLQEMYRKWETCITLVLVMLGFIGEVYCKLDTKARILVPSKFIKQMPKEAERTFVINRGQDKCLVLYTEPEWNKVTEPLKSLNEYSPEEMLFIRQYYSQADILYFDSNNRIMIPKNLLEYADLQKEVVLLGYFNRIEVWDQDAYELMMKGTTASFSNMSKQLFAPGRKSES